MRNIAWKLIEVMALPLAMANAKSMNDVKSDGFSPFLRPSSRHSFQIHPSLRCLSIFLPTKRAISESLMRD
jgi:hypothetical protein